MKASAWSILKWGVVVTLVVLLLTILLINFTTSRDLPELVRVQVERYAVCSYMKSSCFLPLSRGS
jgi:hypothetical protein